MNRIQSQVDDSILCTYVRKKDIGSYRTDLSLESELLQASARLLKQNTHVAAHKHLPINRTTIGTQEAWIVIEGKIVADIYDIDDKKISEVTISSGDAIVFYRGGHSLTVIENDTIFYEFKNGPYNGKENDKQQIN
jgi:cupin fold WbuC family metalloprotein